MATPGPKPLSFTTFLRKYQYHVILATIGFFLVSVFVGYGGYFFGSRESPNDPIAEVGGTKIPLHLFESYYQQALDQLKPGVTLDDATRQQKQQETLRDLIQSLIFYKEAQHYGIRVPDQQVVMSIAQSFLDKNGRFEPQRYGEALRQLRLSPRDFEEQERQRIAFFKLRWLIQSCVKITDKELDMACADPSFHYQDFLKNWTKEHPHTPFNLKEAREDFRNSLWQQKVLWVFNQWFTQVAQHTPIQTHLDLLKEGVQ